MSTQNSKTFVNSNLTFAAAGFNPRAVAALFKLDLMGYFDEWNAERPLRTGFPHASNILAIESEFCLRKLVLMAAFPDEAIPHESKPWDNLTNARFKHGWVVHEKYQDILKRHGTVVYFKGEAELDLTHFNEDYLLHFSPDAIIEHAGEQMVVEIKGYKQESFDKMDETGEAPKDAWNQANLYMHVLGLEYALILVENKNTQEIKTWCVEYDMERVLPYIERLDAFKRAYRAVKFSNEPAPPRKCSKPTDRQAQKCEMRDYCFSHR